MIGDGHSRHCEFFGLFEKIIEADHTVEKTILRMNMEMDEI